MILTCLKKKKKNQPCFQRVSAPSFLAHEKVSGHKYEIRQQTVLAVLLVKVRQSQNSLFFLAFSTYLEQLSRTLPPKKHDGDREGGKKNVFWFRKLYMAVILHTGLALQTQLFLKKEGEKKRSSSQADKTSPVSVAKNSTLISYDKS